ncbi:MAG TPA: serine hydrolase, partial [Thermomicrobiaceae bacterium]|nr:serine hydrolase [Thermomicrobiaceae bacterium]
MRRLVIALALVLLLVPALDARAAVTGTPASTRLEAASTWNGLQGELQALVAGWDGENAVSVTDLQTGQAIAVNGSRPQIAACTIKLGIIMAVAQDIEAGRYTADEVDDLVRSMMGPSNTPPARELLGYVGGGDIGAGIHRVNDLMRGLGATGSVLAHPPGYPDDEYGYGTGDNLLTTDDLNLMLVKLYRGQALSSWATSYVLWSLTIAPDWMNQSLGSPLSSDARLYHKIGQLYEPENTWNDAGLVVFSRNGHDYAYAISYLGSYGPSWQDAYAHAQSASATVWRYFDTAYSGATPPAPPADSRTFPETGFTVAGGFLRYWEQFGGLAAFGYPISEEFVANGVTVQYFERARFEWHPGAWPARFDVLLGR